MTDPRTRLYLASARELAGREFRIVQTPDQDDAPETQRYCRFLADRDAVLAEYAERIESLRAEQSAKVMELLVEYESEVAPGLVEARRDAVRRIDAALPRIIRTAKPQ